MKILAEMVFRLKTVSGVDGGHCYGDDRKVFHRPRTFLPYAARASSFVLRLPMIPVPPRVDPAEKKLLPDVR
jgi:hypothetical protein